MGLLQKALFSKTLVPTTLKSLQATNLRAKAIANNIANASTPGYQRRDVEFESVLKDAISTNKINGYKTNSKHISIGSSRLDKIEPEIIIDSNDLPFSGKNNVDLDKEVAYMADTQMLHNFDVKFLGWQYKMFKEAITGTVR